MKKLSKKVLGIFALLTLFACNYARFDRPPGTSQQEIPEKYRGKFFAKATDKKLNDGNDTSYVIVGKDYYQELGPEKTRNKDKRMLGKDFLFYSHKNLDFIVQRNDEDSLYTIFVVEPNKKGFVMKALDDYSPEQRKENKNSKGKYSKYFTEKCKPNSGLIIWYYVMDESKLAKAYRKKIRKMPGIDFIRIQ